MMTKLCTAMTAGVMLLASATMAQLAAPLDLQVVISGAPVAAATGLLQTEFDGIAINPAGTTINLFDSQSGFDGIVRVTAGTGTVFATAAQLTGGGASASDITANDTHVYVNVRGAGSTRHIWRYPHTATNFTTDATRMVAITGASDEIDGIACDDKNSRLIVVYNIFSASTLEQIAYVPYAAVDATPTVLADQTALNAALATIPGYVDAATHPVDIIDVTVQSDGDIIASQGYSSGNVINGSLLRITETGTVSVLRTAAAIKTSAGVDPNTVNIGSMQVAALPNDDLFICVTFSSNNTTLQPFMAVVGADGTTQRHIGTRTELLGQLAPGDQAAIVPSGQFIFNFDSRHNLAVDSNGDVFFHRQATVKTDFNQSAVFKIVDVLAVPTAAESWNRY